MTHDERAIRSMLDTGVVGHLRLGCWNQVRHRLVARLVPEGRSGPVGWRPPTVPGFGRSPVVLDVGIDVPGGIVRLDRDLVGAWDVTVGRIWEAVIANQDRADRPAVATVAAWPVRLRVVAGGPSTTGWLLRPEQLLATGPGGDRGPGRTSGSARRRWPVVAVAAQSEALVVADRPLGRPGRLPAAGDGDLDDLQRLAAPALALAGRLAAMPHGRALPPAPLLPRRWEGSFPAPWILE